MRRTALAAATAALSALALTACSGADTGTGAQGPYRITYVEGVTGNPFFTSLTCGARAEAKKLGVEFTSQGGDQYSPESQTPVLNAVIAKKPDGIIISPMVGDAMVSPLTQAKQAGIKLAFADTKASDDSLAVSFVASDNYAGGQLAARTLAGKIGDKGKVMVLGAQPGISTTDARQKGFEDEIKKHPSITYLGAQFSDSDPAKATSKLSAALSKDGDLAGVFAVSTQEVEGAATAVTQAGKAGRLKVVGFDTSPPILDAVEAGTVEALIVQKPLEMGKVAVQQLVKSLKAEPTTKEIHTDYVVLDRTTMHEPAVNQYVYKTSCS